MAFKALSAGQINALNRKELGVVDFGTRLNALEGWGWPTRQKWVAPAAAAVAGIRAAVTDTGSPQTITTGFVRPDYARNVTATAGGTATDIKAIQVIVVGKDIEGNVITETLPVFTVDTAGTVQGSKAFSEVTSVTIPAHDGTGATTSIGFGEKLGLNRLLRRNNVFLATFNGSYETTRPTVATSATAIESNTIDINSALNGAGDVVAYFLDEGD